MKLPIHPWPLAIIVFFAVAITGVVTFVTFTLRNRVEMVQPNYYARELTMQGEIETIERTLRSPVQARLQVDSAAQRLLLQWEGPERSPMQGTLEFYRPSESALDFTLPFTLAPGQRFELSTATIRSGFWKIGVRWKIDGEEFYRQENLKL